MSDSKPIDYTLLLIVIVVLLLGIGNEIKKQGEAVQQELIAVRIALKALKEAR